MLVLARKNQESIVVGGTDGLNPLLRVTVIQIGRGTVRLGIEADAEIAVHREEVWKRIRAETQTLNRKQPAEPPRQPVPYL